MEGERKERNICVQEKHGSSCLLFASPGPPTGDLAWNPGMCPDWESNRQRSFHSQAGAQSTDPHQPGQGHM